MPKKHKLGDPESNKMFVFMELINVLSRRQGQSQRETQARLMKVVEQLLKKWPPEEVLKWLSTPHGAFEDEPPAMSAHSAVSVSYLEKVVSNIVSGEDEYK